MLRRSWAASSVFFHQENAFNRGWVTAKEHRYLQLKKKKDQSEGGESERGWTEERVKEGWKGEGMSAPVAAARAAKGKTAAEKNDGV